MFVAVGIDDDTCSMYSYDGVTWSGTSEPALCSGTHQWSSVVWSPDLGIFAAAAMSGEYDRMTSSDGMTWSYTTTASGLNEIAWSSSLGLFAGVRYGGGLQTSPDGITWTSRTPPAGLETAKWSTICWSPDLTLFVALSRSGGDDQAMTSPNGITWTQRSHTGINARFLSVCWSPELTLFVAVGLDGLVATSPDGINWTLRIAAANNTVNWYSVCWSPELALFAAIATNGGTKNIMTSSDGINWTNRTTPDSGLASRSIVWSPELHMFAAPYHLYGSRVLTSSNFGAFSAAFTMGNSVTYETTFGECYDCRLTAWDDATHSSILNEIIAGDHCVVSSVSLYYTGSDFENPDSVVEIHPPAYNKIFKGNDSYYGDFDLRTRTVSNTTGDILFFKPVLYGLHPGISYGVHDFVIVLHYSYT